MAVEWDVIVVGAGPGGAVATSLLAQAGHKVLALDKAPSAYGQPRMSTLDGEIARVLQHAADPREAMRDAIPARTLKLWGADDEPVPPVDWNYKVAGHWSHYSLHQPNIETAMERRISSCATASHRWGWKAVRIEEFPDHVAVEVEGSDGCGGTLQREIHHARYLLGFDGASSFVRQAAGIELNVVHEHDDRWILTDFDALRPLPDILCTTQFRMRPKRAWFAGPNGANRCRTDVRMLPDESIDSELAEDKGYDFLEEMFGLTRTDVRLTRRISYRFRSQIARRFRKGRIFIGGDAAHAMTPYMGQGACCAMRDAANIAWKLRFVLGRSADESILESYETERFAQSLFFVQGSLAMWKAVNEQDPEKAAVRDAAARAAGPRHISLPGLLDGILRRNAAGVLAPAAGTLAPQGTVRLGQEEGLLDDMVGYGAQMISKVPLGDLLGSRRLNRLTELGVHVLRVADTEDGDDGVIVDLDGTYRSLWAELGATALIARPDHYLFGLAENTDDIVRLVDDFLMQIPASQSCRAITA